MMTPTNTTTLEVRNLHTHFFMCEGVLPAMDDVSLSLTRERILGLIDESGSGKPVTGFSIMGLVDPPGHVVGGEILYRDCDLTELAPHELRKLRDNRIAMVFQGPMMTLSPMLRIDAQMVEAVHAHSNMSHKQAWGHARDTLDLMGIPSPRERLRAYSHQLSGRMRQRMAIAIAMLHRPGLIVADEPTTALDVTVQAQILSEVQRLAHMHGTALIWITHDLSIVAGSADEMAMMYAGRIVEHGPVDTVLDTPLRPYTMGLIDSPPSENRRGQCLRQIPGVAPSLLLLPMGCVLAVRCPCATEVYGAAPEITQPLPGHLIRCSHPGARHASSQEVA